MQHKMKKDYEEQKHLLPILGNKQQEKTKADMLTGKRLRQREVSHFYNLRILLEQTFLLSLLERATSQR